MALLTLTSLKPEKSIYIFTKNIVGIQQNFLYDEFSNIKYLIIKGKIKCLVF